MSRPPVVLVLGLALAVWPIWSGPAFPTTDGPSHAHAARIAVGLRNMEAPLVSLYRLREGFAPNQASFQALTRLGPLVGWEAAQRAVASLTVVLLAVTLLLLVRTFAGSSVANWTFAPWAFLLGHHWFLWSGFFDFALSVPLLLATVALAGTRWTGARVAGLQGLLLALYFTHVFTFAVGVGAVVLGLGWQRLRHGLSVPRWALAALPGVGLLVWEIAFGGRSSGGVKWRGLGKAVAGLAIGDWLVTLHPAHLLIGLAVMTATWWTVVRRRGALLSGSGPAFLAGFGLLLLLGSPLVPDAVGEGSYLRARLRLLGTLALIPTVLGEGRLGGARVGRVGLAALGLAALTVHAGFAWAASGRFGRDLTAVHDALVGAGMRRFDWADNALADRERGFFRISAYNHVLHAAVPFDHLIVLGNYEVGLRGFHLRWRTAPDRLVYEPRGDLIMVRLVRRAACWPRVLVLHESDRRLVPLDPALALGASAAVGPFAVTEVTRSGCGAGSLQLNTGSRGD